jgi:hypothetical protein
MIVVIDAEAIILLLVIVGIVFIGIRAARSDGIGKVLVLVALFAVCVSVIRVVAGVLL